MQDVSRFDLYKHYNQPDLMAEVLVRPLKTITHVGTRELVILWQFTYYDLSTSVIPATIFSLVSLHVQGQLVAVSLGVIVTVLIVAIVHFWSYIASFNITNQMVSEGIEQDKRDKSFRPIPAELVTVQGARVRAGIAIAIYISMCVLGGTIWPMLWLAVIVVHNFLSSGSMVVKSVSMTLGTIAMMSTAWHIGGAPFTASAFTWVCTVAIYLFLSCPMQDMRDMKGDKETSRRTLPLIIGEIPARRFLSTVFFISPFVVQLVLLIGPWGSIVPSVLFLIGLINFGGNWLLAWRVWFLRTKQADHRTYMIYTYVFVMYWAVSIGFL